eukprot:3096979-Amphidinium_carterae.1
MNTRWLYVNKGDEQAPQYRARLVARELRTKTTWLETTETTAHTPPYEAMRLLLSFATSTVGTGREIVVSVLDVSRAHFHPRAVRT